MGARGSLVFTLVWIGWIANAQLSVVNVLTFANSLMTDFSWTYFLLAPLIFILWVRSRPACCSGAAARSAAGCAPSARCRSC